MSLPYIHNRGFSLIEILITIAIIGLLSSITLASLNFARARALDGNVRSNLHTIQNQAELYAANTTRYGTAVAVQGSALTVGPAYNQSGANMFLADRALNSALAEAIIAGGSGYYALGPGGLTYAVAVALKSVTGYWCVDTAGDAHIITSASLGGGTVAAQCP